MSQTQQPVPGSSKGRSVRFKHKARRSDASNIHNGGDSSSESDTEFVKAGLNVGNQKQKNMNGKGDLIGIHGKDPWKGSTSSTGVPTGKDFLFYASNSSDSEFSLSSHKSGSDNDSIGGYGKYTMQTGTGSRDVSEVMSSDDTMLHVPNVQVEVGRAEIVFALLVFFANLGELVTDFTLLIWHSEDGLKWASGLTGLFILLGAAALLHQFNTLRRDQMERLFVHAKRIRIGVNCFPPAAPLVTSYHTFTMALKSRRDPMVSNHFLEIADFSRSLSKLQSIFQAAPQAVLQLFLLLQSISEIESFKGAFMTVNILLSLTVMTYANLPSNSECAQYVHAAGHSTSTRLFVGVRMFSSFASRIMSIAFLLFGCRCLLGPEGMVQATIIVVGTMWLPRVMFALGDYSHQLVTARKSRAALSQLLDISCFSTFLGYSATIFFPVGEPLWMFWFVWGETAVFLLFGNVVGWSTSCLSVGVNSVFTGFFILLFVIVPILLPYARASIKHTIQKRNFHRNQVSINLNEFEYVETNLDEVTESSLCQGTGSTRSGQPSQFDESNSSQEKMQPKNAQGAQISV